MAHMRNASSNPKQSTTHGPENAEHELRKAFNCVVEAGTTWFWDRSHTGTTGAQPDEVVTLYKRAYKAYRNEDRLTAERWARTAKHLARALWHEAKIAYLEPHSSDLPYLEGATAEEYNLHEHSDTTEDLLNSVADHVPPGMSQMPDLMRRYLVRGRKHLEYLKNPEYHHELLRAERTKAAHEYGRVLECMALAFEAESMKKAA